jgi:hypothetical protein
METRNGKVVVVVRPGRRTGSVLTWIRQLLPGALLLVASASLPTTEPAEGGSIVVEADDIDSPMSLADALVKGRVGTARE